MTGAASRGVAEPETIEQRGERARLASWRPDGRVAHLSPTAMRPLSADFVGSCLDRLRARGFTSVVTSALSEAECTGFLRAGTLAERHGLDLSAHCAPAASAAVCCAVPRFRHLEWFHDHLRLEPMLFDGVPEPDGGALRPNRERPGLGLELKRADAKRFAA